MQDKDWILLDTETTGFAPPIFVVEIAAQKMRGWEPVGEPFTKLLNQNQDIPPDASRVHGYTREILERDGESAQDVYSAFASYAGNLPLVAYNLEYDLDRVLLPEWQRLGITPIGGAGFCALRLAQRLLDPVPADNCKLQTLRQYYRLPERGAHTGLGDVMTVVDLFGQVLRPIAEQRELHTWDNIVRYATEEWYPSRIAFGKFKGRSIYEARKNGEMRKWLDWLVSSSNERSARMGRWYLRELENDSGREAKAFAATAAMEASTTGIIIYAHPDLSQFRTLVAVARARLAEIEAAYTSDKAKVSALQARLFKHLRPHYEERDRVRLVVSYRKSFLDTLLRHGEDEAQQVEEEFRQADERTQQEYRSTQATMESKRQLSGDDEAEIKSLWKKLVKLFHPDRYADDAEKLETYTKLTAAINAAKDNGDLKTLRSIADDPVGFVLRQGWTAIDFGETDELDQIQRLWESLEAEILAVIEATNALKESPDWELHQLVQREPEVFDQVVEKQIAGINAEVAELKSQAEKLANEIRELSGTDTVGIG